jgi:acyl-CoA synthetase (AMP-forming)/AMP-acid ligase II
LLSISDVETLGELITARARSTDPWLILPEDPIVGDRAVRVSFRDICEKAREFGGGLARMGRPLEDRPIILVFDNNERFCIALLGCLLAGTIPSVRSPPWLYPRFAAELQEIVEHSRASVIVTDDVYRDSIFDACRQIAPCLTVAEIVALGSGPSASPMERPRANPALLQFSSGSTRVPLGVGLSDAAILSNIRSIGVVLNASARDVVVSWLPVAHDMGLIGSLLFSFYWGMPFVLLSPLEFVGKPARWLWALSRFRGTISAAPNLAFNLCVSAKRVPDAGLQGLDLASWRAAVCGAETVHLDTVRAFTDRFAPHGFREEAFCPAYGLAENSVACAIQAPKMKPRADIVDRDVLETKSRAIEVGSADQRASAFMSMGAPIPGTEVRIVNETGIKLPERDVGEIELRGSSMMIGYWRAPDATAAVMTTDGWLRTGDLGYMFGGELYIVGRFKQMIKRGGRCYDAAEMAETAGRVKGVRRGCVSVIGIPDASLGTERIVVLAEVNENAIDFERGTQEDIIAGISGVFGLCPDEVLLLKPGSVPKTSSGKIQIQHCRALYNDGAFSRDSAFSLPPAAESGQQGSQTG